MALSVTARMRASLVVTGQNLRRELSIKFGHGEPLNPYIVQGRGSLHTPYAHPAMQRALQRIERLPAGQGYPALSAAMRVAVGQVAAGGAAMVLRVPVLLPRLGDGIAGALEVRQMKQHQPDLFKMACRVSGGDRDVLALAVFVMARCQIANMADLDQFSRHLAYPPAQCQEDIKAQRVATLRAMMDCSGVSPYAMAAVGDRLGRVMGMGHRYR